MTMVLALNLAILVCSLSWLKVRGRFCLPLEELALPVEASLSVDELASKGKKFNLWFPVGRLHDY